MSSQQCFPRLKSGGIPSHLKQRQPLPVSRERAGLRSFSNISQKLYLLCSIFLLQMPAISHWTQIQPIWTSFCLKTTGRWHGQEFQHSIIVFRAKCCVETVWPIAVTGRLSGKDWFPSGYLIKDSEEKVRTSGPGSWSALKKITLSCMMTKKQSYTAFPLCPTELECMWTGRLASCPSLQCSLTHGSASTPSTAHSLSLSIPQLGSGSNLRCWGVQHLCVTCRKERELWANKQLLTK